LFLTVLVIFQNSLFASEIRKFLIDATFYLFSPSHHNLIKAIGYRECVTLYTTKTSLISGNRTVFVSYSKNVFAGISNSTILPGAKERSDSITTSRYVVPFVENTSFAAVNASVFINILKQAPVDTFTSQSSSHSKTAKALIASSLSTITTKSTDQSVLSDASSTHLYELKPTSTAITQNVIVSSAEIPRISTKPYSSAQSTTQTYTSHLIPTNTVTNFSTLELNEASSAIAKNSQSGYSTLAPFSGSLDKTPFPNTQANYVAATTSASLQIKSEGKLVNFLTIFVYINR